MSSTRVRPTRLLRSQSGITLMELMITVVIIGLIAAMAGPRLGQEMSKKKFRGSARELVSALRQARSLAVSEKTPCGVFCDLEGATVTVFKDVVFSDPPTMDAGDETIRTDTIPGDYPILYHTFADPAIMFSPSGSASSSGDIFIISYGSEGTTSTMYARVSVLGATGRIRLEELETY